MKQITQKIEDILSGVNNVETKTTYKHSWDYVKRLESIVRSAGELAEAAEKIDCSCSFLDKQSGHITDCAFPEFNEALEKFTKTIEGE